MERPGHPISICPWQCPSRVCDRFHVTHTRHMCITRCQSDFQPHDTVYLRTPRPEVTVKLVAHNATVALLVSNGCRPVQVIVHGDVTGHCNQMKWCTGNNVYCCSNRICTDCGESSGVLSFSLSV